MRRTREDGFTLVELIMTIALLSVVSLTVVGMVYTVARSGVSNQNRLNHDNQIMLASNFFAQDVAAAAGGTTGGISTPASVPCGTLAGYFPVVLLVPGVIATPPVSTTLQAVFYAQSGTAVTPGTTLIRGECRGTSSTLSSDSLSTITLMTDLSRTALSASCYAAATTTASACSPSTTVAVSVSGSLSTAWQSGFTTTNFNLFGVRRAT